MIYMLRCRCATDNIGTGVGKATLYFQDTILSANMYNSI